MQTCCACVADIHSSGVLQQLPFVIRQRWLSRPATCGFIGLVSFWVGLPVQTDLETWVVISQLLCTMLRLISGAGCGINCLLGFFCIVTSLAKSYSSCASASHVSGALSTWGAAVGFIISSVLRKPYKGGCAASVKP